MKKQQSYVKHRAFLNRDRDMTGAVSVSVNRYKDGVDATIKISDCNQTITLYFDNGSPFEKISRLRRALSLLEQGLKESFRDKKKYKQGEKDA